MYLHTFEVVTLGTATYLLRITLVTKEEEKELREVIEGWKPLMERVNELKQYTKGL